MAIRVKQVFRMKPEKYISQHNIPVHMHKRIMKIKQKKQDKSFQENFDQHMNNIKHAPKNIHKHVKKHFNKMMRIEDTPERIGLSFALGVFIGFWPLLWFDIFVLIPIMLWTRVNKLSIMLGTFVINGFAMYIMTPICYKVGAAILNFELADMSIKTIHTAYPSVFLGSVIFGAIFAIPSYFLSRYAVIKYRERQIRKLK